MAHAAASPAAVDPTAASLAAAKPPAATKLRTKYEHTGKKEIHYICVWVLVPRSHLFIKR